MMSQEERRKVCEEKVYLARLGVSVPISGNYCRRSTPEYPSVPDTVGVAPRGRKPRYTGTLVRGISTMHKSNAVPIIDEQQMKDDNCKDEKIMHDGLMQHWQTPGRLVNCI